MIDQKNVVVPKLFQIITDYRVVLCMQGAVQSPVNGIQLMFLTGFIGIVRDEHLLQFDGAAVLRDEILSGR